MPKEMTQSKKTSFFSFQQFLILSFKEEINCKNAENTGIDLIFQSIGEKEHVSHHGCFL